jgi:uncharacterized membrane protein
MDPIETTPSAEAGNGNIMAVFAYLGVLIIVPFLTEAKSNPFVKFHLKQGLVLLVAYVVLMVLNNMFMFGFYFMGGFGLFQLLYLALAILDIIGIINAATGKQKELPLIGQFSKHFTF